MAAKDGDNIIKEVVRLTLMKDLISKNLIVVDEHEGFYVFFLSIFDKEHNRNEKEVRRQLRMVKKHVWQKRERFTMVSVYSSYLFLTSNITKIKKGEDTTTLKKRKADMYYDTAAIALFSEIDKKEADCEEIFYDFEKGGVMHFQLDHLEEVFINICRFLVLTKVLDGKRRNMFERERSSQWYVFFSSIFDE